MSTKHSLSIQLAGKSDLATRGSLVPVCALIGANLIPFAGVLFFDWRAGDIMLLFWAESAVIGIYNLLRMWVIARWGMLFLGAFFFVHYGGFMVGHLVFIYALFQDNLGTLDPGVKEILLEFLQLWPALLGLFLSHGVSFFMNFLGHREYVDRTLRQQMFEPYRRIVIMHTAILFGGFLTMAFGAPVLALVLLIALKIAVDVRAHLGEHSRRLKNAAHH